MTKISNYEKYINGMEKSMIDKIFWFDKIPKQDYSVVVDYGCANGSFLKALREYNDECFVCGVNIDPKIVQLAEKLNIKNSIFISEDYNNTNSFIEWIKTEYNSVLNLSSVLYEIYNHKSEEEINKFWDFVNGYKYICISDMCINSKSVSEITPPTLYYKNYEELKRVSEHELIYGLVSSPISFVHYMLKYRHIENWNREVKENYIIDFGNLIDVCIKLGNYDIIYLDHYTPQFLQEEIKKDWGIDFDVNTHVKLILKKRN